MQTSQGNMLLSLQNGQRFLGDNAAALADGVPPEVTQMLGDSIAELSEHASVQNGQTRAAKSAFARQQSRREALLRDHMAPIARIATLQLSGTPELISLSMPKGRPTAERLAALAEGMAHAATPYADVFTKAGMKPDFIQSLQAASADMLTALQDRTQSRGKVRTATSALRNKLSRGRKVIKVVDAFVKSALVGNQDLLDGWNLVKRIPLPRNTAPAAAATPAAPSTPVASAAPADAPSSAATPAVATPEVPASATPAAAA